MQVVHDEFPDGPLLEYPRIREQFLDAHADYGVAEPFPHAVFEDFIGEPLVDRLLEEFPSPSADISWRQLLSKRDDGSEVQFNKQGMPHLMNLSPTIRQLIWELNSGTFIRALEKLTGIPNLIPDPALRGAGLHQVLPGGVLAVHADFTRHQDYQLERRINLLLYLNRDWKDEYEGHLELWNSDMSRCVRRLRPSAGRCVVFNTDATSFHGHPRPLNCPGDTTRKSIALYYYTLGREDKAVEPTRRTDWQILPAVALPDPS